MRFYGVTVRLFSRACVVGRLEYAFKNNVNSIREELINMGAKPSTEELSALKFETPVEVNGVLIDDFADFEETYGDVYDLWGVSRTVEASYGTYYTYDVMIQDVNGGNRLGTSVSQGGRPGWDLYAAGSSAADLIETEINNAAFDRIVECAVAGLKYSNVISGAYSTLKSILSMIGGIDADDPVTVEGHTKSYTIFCDISPTIHFVFVRDSLTGPWQHSLTTNTAAVMETHDVYMVVSQNGYPHILDDETYSYEKTLIPDDYGLRLTNAISAYRYDKSLYIDSLCGYTIVVKAGTADNEGEEVFTLEITCAEGQFNLLGTEYSNYWILGTIGILCFIFVLFAVQKKRKNT